MGERKNKLYYLHCKELAKANSNEGNMTFAAKREYLELWHRQLGHAGNTKIHSAIKNKAIYTMMAICYLMPDQLQASDCTT